MPETPKLSDAAKSWTMRETVHLNGGKEWFGYIHQCIQEPRLSRLDKYIRKDRSVISTWRVDGSDVASFDAALEALLVPPVVSAEQLRVLKRFTDEFVDRRKDPDAEYIAVRALRDCGLVEMERGRGRLTNAGRAALSAMEASDAE